MRLCPLRQWSPNPIVTRLSCPATVTAACAHRPGRADAASPGGTPSRSRWATRSDAKTPVTALPWWEQHRACLAAMASAGDRAIATTPGSDIGTPQVGLRMVLFAGELAAAIQPGQYRGELPASLVAAREQTVTAATLVAAECLAGLVQTVQTLSALAT